VIDRVEFTPRLLRSTGPATIRVRVSDTRGFRVSGATLRLSGVPASLLRRVADVRTGSDGWARLTVRPSTRVVFRRLGGIPLLVRAFEPGESATGGIAAQRSARLPLGAPRGRR
jgi:hypothetical protein